MSDNGLISLGAQTEFEFVQYEHDGPGGNADRAVYYLHAGCMRTVTGNIGDEPHDEYRLESDYGEVRINGTTYRCTVDSGLFCGVSDGGIIVGNAGTDLALGLGNNYDDAMVAQPDAEPVPLLQEPPLRPGRFTSLKPAWLLLRQ